MPFINSKISTSLTEAQEKRFCDLAFDYHVEQLLKGDGHDYSEDFLREKREVLRDSL